MKLRSNRKLWPAEVPGRCNFAKRNRTRCKSYPVLGELRCRLHRRAIGPDSSGWKGGISKEYQRRFLPQRLLARYDEIINSEELCSVRHLLAVTATRLTELYEKLETLESSEAWKQIGELLAQAEELQDQLKKSKQGQELGIVLELMRRHYRNATHERHVWEDIHRTIERARRLAKTETEREAMLDANLTARQSIALFNKLFEILSEELKDADVRARIGQRLIELLQYQQEPRALIAAQSNGR